MKPPPYRYIHDICHVWSSLYCFLSEIYITSTYLSIQSTFAIKFMIHLF